MVTAVAGRKSITNMNVKAQGTFSTDYCKRTKTNKRNGSQTHTLTPTIGVTLTVEARFRAFRALAMQRSQPLRGTPVSFRHYCERADAVDLPVNIHTDLTRFAPSHQN